jgi:predicted ATP-dependent endonuclease of OLD family
MRIISLKLENFRTYKEKTSLEDLKGLNIFIGPNNSGKSNVVHALRILRDLASTSVSLLTPDIFRKEINENEVDGEITIEVVIDLLDSERKVLMKSLGGDHLVNELPEKSILRRVRYFVKLNRDGTIHEELSILNNRNEYSNIIINSKDRKGTTRTTNLREVIQSAKSTDSLDSLSLVEETTWLPEWIMLKTTDQNKPLEYGTRCSKKL